LLHIDIDLDFFIFILLTFDSIFNFNFVFFISLSTMRRDVPTMRGSVWLQRALMCFGVVALLAMALSFRFVYVRQLATSPKRFTSTTTTTTATMTLPNSNSVAMTTSSPSSFRRYDVAALDALLASIKETEEILDVALEMGEASFSQSDDNDSDSDPDGSSVVNATPSDDDEPYDVSAEGDSEPVAAAAAPDNVDVIMVNGRPIRGTRSEQSARLMARKQRELNKSLRHQSDVFAAKIADAAAKVGDGDRDVLLLAKLLVNKGLVDHRSAEAAGAAQANDTEHYTLDLQDMLTSRNFVGGEIEKKEKQGKFEAAGWRTVGVESQIMIELERAFAPYESGAIEVDLTGFDPVRQFGKSSDKHHILCLYSASDGAHGGWDDNTKAWLCWRVGKEYVSDSTGTAGCKIQAVPRGSQSHIGDSLRGAPLGPVRHLHAAHRV
jgi:hypothetical protein